MLQGCYARSCEDRAGLLDPTGVSTPHTLQLQTRYSCKVKGGLATLPSSPARSPVTNECHLREQLDDESTHLLTLDGMTNKRSSLVYFVGALLHRASRSGWLLLLLLLLPPVLLLNVC